MDGLVDGLLDGSRAEMAVVAEHGGAVQAVDYMKTQLVIAPCAGRGHRAGRPEGGRPKRVHEHRALTPARARTRGS